MGDYEAPDVVRGFGVNHLLVQGDPPGRASKPERKGSNMTPSRDTRSDTRRSKLRHPGSPHPSFPVIQEKQIAVVVMDGEGDLTPVEAALRHIARRDEGGHFKFAIPEGDGAELAVRVEIEYGPGDESKQDVALYRKVLKRATSYNQSIDEAVIALVEDGQFDSSTNTTVLAKNVYRWLDQQ